MTSAISRAISRASFRTKVLVPVMVCMVLLIAATVLVVNRRVTQQFQTEAREALTSADAQFQSLLKNRSEDLLLRFRNLPSEPRYRAAFQLGDAPTLRGPLADLLGEQGADIVLYASRAGQVLAAEKRDPSISVAGFEVAAAPAMRLALDGNETVDTLQAGGRLYNVVAIPVYVGRERIGALTLGLGIGDAEARKFSQLTHSQIALFAGQRVIASPLADPGVREPLLAIFARSGAARDAEGAGGTLRQIDLAGQHYFARAGRFKSLNGDPSLGYVLLRSYEPSLRALQKTQQALLGVSLCAILLGGAIVWLLINTVTRPLRKLRDSVEAVGRGDFSRRVEVRHEDEFGELARVYNRMTENLQSSREQLEKAYAELVESSRLAGMAEVATGVLHNVGNVLTSVTVASSLIAESLKRSKASNLARVVALLHDHQADLGAFLSQDPKGKQVPDYLAHLSEYLIREQEATLQELAGLQQGIEHIQNIVSAQQRFSRRSGVPERLRVAELLEDALNMNFTTKGAVQIVKEFAEDLTVTVEKHKALQILVNLVRNARQACDGSPAPTKTVTVRASNGDGHVRIAVSDNGVGIDPAHLDRIFSHGFTTKRDGHGFGLHHSALVAKELGGALLVHSDGVGKGATFTLQLPLEASTPQKGAGPEQGSVSTIDSLRRNEASAVGQT
jgi:signal transduction histidine kinase